LYAEGNFGKFRKSTSESETNFVNPVFLTALVSHTNYIQVSEEITEKHKNKQV